MATESSIADHTPAELSTAALLERLPGFHREHVNLGDISLNVVIGGDGPALVLLPGWPQTWWAYHEIMPELAQSHRVIAVDLRGMGESSRPADGYDKRTMARDISRLLEYLGIEEAGVVGHDVGAAVAYSLAANYPQVITRIAMLDFVHFSREWYSIPLLPAAGTFDSKKANAEGAYLWWFALHQVEGLSEALLEGRAHLEHEWFFDYMSANSESIDSFDRAVYRASFAHPDAVRAGNAWFRAVDRDVIDYESYSPITAPILGLGTGAYGLMAALLPSKGNDVTVVQVPDSGHFPVSENPEFVLEQLRQFFAA